MCTSLKSLKLADHFSSPSVGTEKSKKGRSKRTAKASINGQVLPKSDVASPEIAASTITNEKQRNDQHEANASSISSIKPYEQKNELGDETDISATRFACNHTESPSKTCLSPYLEQAGVRDKKESGLLMSDQTATKRQTLTAKKLKHVIEEQASPPPAELSRNTGACGGKLEAQEQL